jgi:hypothetical protein
MHLLNRRLGRHQNNNYMQAYRTFNSAYSWLLLMTCGMCNAITYKENFVASVLASEYARFKKNHLILDFQAICHTTGNSVTRYTPLVQELLISSYTETKEIICGPTQQHLTSFSQTALDGAVGLLGNRLGLKMISSSE